MYVVSSQTDRGASLAQHAGNTGNTGMCWGRSERRCGARLSVAPLALPLPTAALVFGGAGGACRMIILLTPEPPLLHPARPEVLNERVGPPNQSPDHLAALGTPKVHRDRQLVPLRGRECDAAQSREQVSPAHYTRMMLGRVGWNDEGTRRDVYGK